MSEVAEVPTWTLGWRLQRALDFAGVSVQDMADELDVSRGTISRWCNDHGSPPRSIYLRAWATRCRVPMVWLQYGDDGLPRVDSNHQPAGSGIERPGRDEILAFRRTVRPLAHHDRAKIGGQR
ncbi:MAG: helix-turn-helix domain-containing protein [Candidatus Rokuibacteriota bacterium]